MSYSISKIFSLGEGYENLSDIRIQLLADTGLVGLSIGDLIPTGNLYIWKYASVPDNFSGVGIVFRSGLQPPSWTDGSLPHVSFPILIQVEQYQHVVVDSGTITNLTNLPNIPASWLTSAGTSADFITRVQSGLTANITGWLGVAPSSLNNGQIRASITGIDGVIFPTEIASRTNITSATGIGLAANQHVIVDSGTITTLTNLPSITASWLTVNGVHPDLIAVIKSGLEVNLTGWLGTVPLALANQRVQTTGVGGITEEYLNTRTLPSGDYATQARLNSVTGIMNIVELVV